MKLPVPAVVLFLVWPGTFLHLLPFDSRHSRARAQLVPTPARPRPVLEQLPSKETQAKLVKSVNPAPFVNTQLLTKHSSSISLERFWTSSPSFPILSLSSSNPHRRRSNSCFSLFNFSSACFSWASRTLRATASSLIRIAVTLRSDSACKSKEDANREENFWLAETCAITHYETTAVQNREAKLINRPTCTLVSVFNFSRLIRSLWAEESWARSVASVLLSSWIWLIVVLCSRTRSSRARSTCTPTAYFN